MNTDTCYRIIGDIIIKNKSLTIDEIRKDKTVDISYGNRKATNFNKIAIIQTLQPLTSKMPYFLIKVQRYDPNAILSIGIAPLDIDKHSGLYNNSLGYHSHTGRIYTSWKAHANTLGRPYGKDNTVGIYVTYFGEHHSTVLIFYDNLPIATRYHFEENKERYFPTITFSGGHIDISVLWPNAIDQLPSITDIPVCHWVRASSSSYNSKTGYFENLSKIPDSSIQSPISLCKSFSYFIVTQEEVSSLDGKGASVGLATFSPLKPTTTYSLMKDYYTWFPKIKSNSFCWKNTFDVAMKVGNTIGWGIFYDENCQDDKIEQLCLVFVMFNNKIIDALFVLQPEGGFVPIVLLQPYATKVSIEIRNVLTKEEFSDLQELYIQMLEPAIEIYEKDKNERNLTEDLFRKSDEVLLNNNDYACRVSIPTSKNSLHYIQFNRPLTYERRFFFVELDNINQQCQVIVGVASSKNKLNEAAPGILQDTVGYNSSTGKLYSSRKHIGNMRGHRCKKGDTMGVEIQVFNKDMSVILFSKNFRPIGTRYLTLNDHSEYFPTVFIENNHYPVELSIYWQTRIAIPPYFCMKNPEDWCVPNGTKIDLQEKIFILPQHINQSLCIQAPYSLNKKCNHFEIILLDKISDDEPLPAIALCTASPMNSSLISEFKQDYLRFWATDEAAKYLNQGDKIGWSILFPEEENEQLIICYLTINDTVGYARVLYQPIGGFYPVVIAPPNVNRIQINFSATKILSEDFTSEQIKTLVMNARHQIEEEQELQLTKRLMGKNNKTINEQSFIMNSTKLHDKQYNTNVPIVKSAACIIL
ncbi:unnamed protein product [Adineta steineri]|uniref:B30.2/SPRY domain-containing protein n=1 Tax=Adineta steineri TaxID=433720 RepID=A0A814NVI5_9BILA|nr:unnamed protein product [Adineta steineri]